MMAGARRGVAQRPCEHVTRDFAACVSMRLDLTPGTAPALAERAIEVGREFREGGADRIDVLPRGARHGNVRLHLAGAHAVDCADGTNEIRFLVLDADRSAVTLPVH